MISKTSALALLTGAFTDYGTAILIILGIVLGIGIGYLIFKFGWKTLMNLPGGIGYNSKYGSGMSRFNRAKTLDSAGGHMKAYEF